MTDTPLDKDREQFITDNISTGWYEDQPVPGFAVDGLLVAEDWFRENGYDELADECNSLRGELSHEFFRQNQDQVKFIDRDNPFEEDD